MDNMSEMYSTREPPWDSVLWLLLGVWSWRHPLPRPYQNSQTPIRKEGVQCGPYCLYKQFRHLDSLLSVGVVETLLKSKFTTFWVGFQKTVTRPALFCTLTKENFSNFKKHDLHVSEEWTHAKDLLNPLMSEPAGKQMGSETARDYRPLGKAK